MTELRARLLSGVVDFFWSKKLLKLSVACNVALGALLLLVVVYSYAVAPDAEASELQRRSGKSLAADPADVIPNPTEAASEAATPHPAEVPPGWVSIPLSSSFGLNYIFKHDQPQKLAPVVVAALEMTPGEVSAIEALAVRASTKVGTAGSVSVRFEYVPPVRLPNEKLELVCKEFENGCIEILGEIRGTALADATLMSSSFLARAYPGRSNCFRFREERRRRQEQIARVAKPQQLSEQLYFQTLRRIDPASDGNFINLKDYGGSFKLKDSYQLDRDLVLPAEEGSE